jgi:hypothetical protein
VLSLESVERVQSADHDRLQSRHRKIIKIVRESKTTTCIPGHRHRQCVRAFQRFDKQFFEGVSQMIYNTMKMVVVVAVVCASNQATAQVSSSYGGVAAPTSYSGGSMTDGNCGRGITQSEAAALWADYCTENCGHGDHCRRGCGLFNRGCGGCATGCHTGFGAGCGRGCDAAAVDECGNISEGGCLGGCRGGLKCRLGGRRCGGGLFASRSACGCDLGCFGYPDACGCDTGGGCMGGKFRGLFSRGHDCGCDMDPCDNDCGGNLGGLFGGCGCGNGCGLGGKLKGLFSRNRSCCGDPCGYFNANVGQEYGTSGMQSCVSGCGTVSPNAMPSTVSPAANAPMAPNTDDASSEEKSAAEAAVEELKEAAENN